MKTLIQGALNIQALQELIYEGFYLVHEGNDGSWYKIAFVPLKDSFLLCMNMNGPLQACIEFPLECYVTPEYVQNKLPNPRTGFYMAHLIAEFVNLIWNQADLENPEFYDFEKGKIVQ